MVVGNMPRGLSNRAMGRIAGTYLLDEVKIEIYAGKLKGIPQWTDKGTYNCRLLDRAAWTYTNVGTSQNYDAQIIMLTSDLLIERNSRYRLTVVENKSGIEKADPDGPPEAKRTRVLEAASFDAYKDSVGSDFLQVIRCVNGRENA